MIKANIVFIKIKNRIITINLKVPQPSSKKEIFLLIYQKDKKSELSIVPIYNDCYEINFELDDNDMCIELFAKYNNVYEPIRYDFDYYSPISNSLKNSYCYINNYKITSTKFRIKIQKTKHNIKFVDEARYQHELLKDSRYKFKDILLRNLAILFKKYKKKKILLFYDRVDVGNDNAEFLFNYFDSLKNNKIKIYFLINQKGYKNYKNSVKFFSFKEKVLFLICDMKISSHAAHYTNFPFENKIDAYRDIICNQKFIFLQHGIIKDEMPDWLNRYRRNIHAIIVSTKFEKDLLLNKKYLYKSSNIWMTGMPRYDRIKNDKTQNIILVAFTWRKYLMSDNFDKLGNRKIIDNFGTSNYYIQISKLLCDKQVNSLLKTFGYKIHFKIHPMFRECLHLFPKSDYVVFESTDEFENIINISDILITDYSSIAFDFAYLHKPVIYFQFDFDEFYSGNHTYIKGNYDFSSMGFGRIVTTIDDLSFELTNILKKSSDMDIYKSRTSNFFCYNDQKNCERIYNKIIETLDE